MILHLNTLQKSLCEINKKERELLTLSLSCFKYFYINCMLINYDLSLTKRKNHNINELMTHE